MSGVPKFAGSRTGSRVGRAGLPADLVDRIYADYQRLKSCAKVGALHGGRTRQAIHELLKTHRRTMQPLKRQSDAVWHEGLKFTPDHQGYLRVGNHTKCAGEVYLHRRIWRAAHGEIPPGMEVLMRDGDKRNVEIENLALGRAGEASRAASSKFYLEKSRARTRAVLKINQKTSAAPAGVLKSTKGRKAA